MVHIFELLGKKSNSRVLAHFLAYPTEETYSGQLLKRLKIAKKSLLDALAALLHEGLIGMKQVGRTKQYRLNRDDVRVKQLKILRTIDTLLPLLAKASGVEVYLFGSAARGEDNEKSDIDLLLLGDRDRNDIIGELRKEERINPVYFTYLEYSALIRKDKPFYDRIEKDKIRLV